VESLPDDRDFRLLPFFQLNVLFPIAGIKYVHAKPNGSNDAHAEGLVNPVAYNQNIAGVQ
jgi:hypothetical protein